MHYPIIRTGFIIAAALFASCSSLLEVANKPVASDSFDYADTTSDGWIRLRSDSLWGFYHPGRQRFVTPQLAWAANFSHGHALVYTDSQYYFLNTKGKIRPRRAYNWAYSYTEGKAAAQQDTKFGYLDTRGHWLIKPQFDWALPFDRGQAIVVENQQYGLIGADGELLVPTRFDEIRPYSSTLYKVRNGNRFGLLDRNGRTVLPANYRKIELQENQYSIITAVDKLQGMVDPQGNMVLPVEFTSIGPVVSGGFRFLQRQDQHGLSDSTGHIVVPPRYDQLGFPSENRIAALQDGKWGYLDFSGRIAIPFRYPEEGPVRVSRSFSENRAWTTTDSLVLLIDTSGRTIRELPGDAFDQVYSFRQGRAFIQRDSATYYSFYGFIDRNGDTVLPTRYDAVGAFNKHGIGWVGYSEKHNGFLTRRLIDTTGQPINDRRYNQLERIGNRYILGTEKTKTLIDPRTGEEMAMEFASISERKTRRDSVFFVVTDGQGNSRLLDSDMHERIPAGYRSFGSMDASLVWVYNAGKWGLSDYQGQLRIPIVYDTESGWSEAGLFTASKNRRGGVIDTLGREIVPFHYNNVYIDETSGHIIAHRKGEAPTDLFDLNGRPVSVGEWDYIGGFYGQTFTHVRKDGKIGVVDIHMNIICEPKYDNIGRFRTDDGIAWVVLDKKVGYIDTNFNVVIPMVYDDGTVFANGMVRVKKNGETRYLNRSGAQVFPTQEEIEAYDKKLEEIKYSYDRIMFSS